MREERPRSVEQYLAESAEPESAAAGRLEGSFGHALQIPAYGERESLEALLASVPAGPKGPVLIVLVVNAKAKSPDVIHAANRAALERIANAAPRSMRLSESPSIEARALAAGTLVVIDRAAKGSFFPPGEGIGLARKIGYDFLLRARHAGRVASDWIHGTDADAILPNDYFDQVERIEPPGTAAAVYAFEHRMEGDPALSLAGKLHEIVLRYWTLGLAWAGSPYAYEHLGSLLAIRPAAYAAAGGFPRRNALEDIAMLDRLARLGGIERMAGSPVALSARISERVPEGSTGREVARLSATAGEGMRLPHPVAFAHLAAWLRALSAIARSGGDIQAALAELPSGNPFFTAGALEEALEKMGAFEAIREAIGRERRPDRLFLELHAWLDAFRSRELLERLGRAGLPPVHWRQALSEAPFTGLSGTADDEPETLRRLLALEEAALSVSQAGLPAMELDRA